MAPLPKALSDLLSRSLTPSSYPAEIQGLSVSSLELDRRSTTPLDTLNQILGRDVTPTSPKDIQAAHRLVTRTTSSTHTPCVGCKSPTSFNNSFYLALFATLGAAMVLASIWFFFWAKNGGFQWSGHDWDDYKSTVLRRKGPDGKTLSNATKSTKLGGGSVVHNQARWEAKTVVGRDEKGRKGVLGKRGFAGTHSIGYHDDFTTQFSGDTMTEQMSVAGDPRRQKNHRSSDKKEGGDHSKRYSNRDDVRAYRAEKPARVGGLNRPANGTDYTGSEAMSETMTERSSEPVLAHHRKQEARHANVESKARDMEREWRREAERAAAAIARENGAGKTQTQTPKLTPSKPRDSARRSSRSASPKKREGRDFSFSAGDDHSSNYYSEYRPRASGNPREARGGRQASRSRSPRKNVPGSYGDDDSETGTKIYEHKMGGRKGRDVMAGYRRGGRDELSDEE